MKKLLIIPALIGTTLFAGINGTSSCSNAVAVELNQDITLSPNQNKTYNGNPQKYGYYSFSVAQETEAVISFDTPNDSGTYMALYSNCRSSIASKWSASNTTGMIEKTLPAGTYQFYISKDGSTVKDIKVNIVASTDTVTPPENGGGDTNHKALTRAELDELMHAWAKNPSEENANKIINANTSEITDMSRLFTDSYTDYTRSNPYARDFTLDVSGWDVSNVTNMHGMFAGATTTYRSGNSFSQDISMWDVSSVKDMSRMFSGGGSLSGITNWDVSSVTNMEGMFYDAGCSQDIGNWDVSSVTNMKEMFAGSTFNQDISKWDISNVKNMDRMFGYASVFRAYPYSHFNQDISNWDVSNVESHIDFSSVSGWYGVRNPLLTDAHNPFKKNTPPATGNQLSGASVCTNATNITVNQELTLSPSNNKTYNGNPQKYGYYSFTVAENTQASISFDTPNDSGSYMALYSHCTSLVASKWSAANTTGTIAKTLPAGTYQFYISKDGSTVKDIKVNIVASTDTVTPPTTGNQLNGTKVCTNATNISLNQDVTLSPSNDKTYNGTPQKYGYYSFTVAENTQASISFDTPNDSGSYMALYSNCTSLVASKWSASNTTGTIEKTLSAGTYQFYISKDGRTVKDIKVNIHL